MYYEDYYWDKLTPKGLKQTTQELANYKIVVDPYRRFYVIERRREGIFCEILYDSSLVDARQFHERELLSWERVFWKEEAAAQFFFYVRRDEKIAMIEERPHDHEKPTIFRSACGRVVFYQRQEITRESSAQLQVTLYDPLEKKVLERSFSLEGEQVVACSLKDSFKDAAISGG